MFSASIGSESAALVFTQRSLCKHYMHHKSNFNCPHSQTDLDRQLF